MLAFVAWRVSTPELARADDAKATARLHFGRGAELVQDARWADALAEFERSFDLVPHPVTLFNVAACERAMGRYARARHTLLRTRALDEEWVHEGKASLPPSVRSDVDAFLSEIDAILVTVDVTLTPESATIAVDGRPLVRESGGPPARFYAGVAPPGPGQTAAPVFQLTLDPGTHVLVLAQPGFADIVRRETFARGEKRTLDLTLARLDGTLAVTADRDNAAVSVDGVDVGLAPLELRRPAGSYRVVVRKRGFSPFVTDAALEPGGRVRLSASLAPERVALTKRWWFWAAAGGVVASAAAVTYFASRPEPERPPADGGGLGWVLRAP
jgi:hypothetical protein